MDKKYTYEVIRKITVDPDNMSPLAPEEGKELVSLVTCFPYAVNTHRLIVTGEKKKQEVVPIDTSKNSSVELLDKKSNYFTEYLPLSISIAFSALLILISIVLMLIGQKKLTKKLSQQTKNKSTQNNFHKVE
jgi:sortase A